MSDRQCDISDLRIRLDVTPDLRVAADGTPRTADLDEIANLLKADWSHAEFEWYYGCQNCWETSGALGSHEFAVGSCRASEAFAILHGRPLPPMQEAAGAGPSHRYGLPHRGAVGSLEKDHVREHLAEVNARRQVAGYPEIDPANPADAKRYGLARKHHQL